MDFKVGDRVIYREDTPNKDFRGVIGTIVKFGEVLMVQVPFHRFPDSGVKFVRLLTKLEKALL